MGEVIKLFDKIIPWVCRRYLTREARYIAIDQMIYALNTVRDYYKRTDRIEELHKEAVDKAIDDVLSIMKKYRSKQ